MEKKIVFLCDTDAPDSEKVREMQSFLVNRLRQEDLEESVQVVRAADLGIYGQGMVAYLLPDETWFAGLSIEEGCRFFESVILRGEKPEELRAKPGGRQVRIVLRNCGIIDPENIDEYIARDGYLALERVLFEKKPEESIEELKASGLRGRGGAGFPVWRKWLFTREAPGAEKFVICNGDEGDPGAYMDRSIMEGDPYSVLEGLTIAGRLAGAGKGYFYIRAEYPLAISRVQNAIDRARERGLLGRRILGSDFSFDVEIRLGAGAFVCGEETALIASLEGRRGTPRPRPPYPSVKGLWNSPTVINNVETLANVPAIFQKGAEWFAGFGTEKSPGTKVFALTGKVRNSGLIEVPMGMTLREIVEDIGGGTQSESPLKAVQTGGPSGGVIPLEHLDTPVDYENLQALGSIMGSGGMIVMDETDCMVDIARFYIRFCVDESCGKCGPCRYGTYLMLRILDRVTTGKARPTDLDKLRKLGEATSRASLCGLGQTSANPVLSTMGYFADEYREHIKQKKCRACRCSDLITYWINQENCTRCGMCARECPVGAVSGDRDRGYYIQLDKCVKCGKCFDVCRFDAVSRE